MEPRYLIDLMIFESYIKVMTENNTVHETICWITNALTHYNKFIYILSRYVTVKYTK